MRRRIAHTVTIYSQEGREIEITIDGNDVRLWVRSPDHDKPEVIALTRDEFWDTVDAAHSLEDCANLAGPASPEAAE